MESFVTRKCKISPPPKKKDVKQFHSQIVRTFLDRSTSDREDPILSDNVPYSPVTEV